MSTTSFLASVTQSCGVIQLKVYNNFLTSLYHLPCICMSMVIQ